MVPVCIRRPDHDKAHSENGERNADNAPRRYLLRATKAANDRDEGRRRRDEERRVTGARPGDPLDEENLINSVPEHAEQHQRDRVPRARPALGLDREHARCDLRDEDK